MSVYAVILVECKGPSALSEALKAVVESGATVLDFSGRYYRELGVHSCAIAVGGADPALIVKAVGKVEGVKRCLVLTTGASAALHSLLSTAVTSIEEQFGVAGKALAFHMGFMAGLRVAEESPATGDKEILEGALLSYMGGGYGAPKLLSYSRFLKTCKVRVYGNFECIGRRSSEPMGHVFRGYLAGVLKKLWGVEVEVVETKCVAKGDEYCEFVASPR